MEGMADASDRYPSRQTFPGQYKPEFQYRRARTHPGQTFVSKSREFCSIPVSYRPTLTPVKTQGKIPISQRSSKTPIVRSTVLSRSRAKTLSLSKPGSKVKLKLSNSNFTAGSRIKTMGQRSAPTSNRTSTATVSPQMNKKFTLQNRNEPPTFTPRTRQLMSQNSKYNPYCLGCQNYRELMCHAVEIISSRDSTIETQSKELKFFIACNVELNEMINRESMRDKNSCSYCGGPIRKALRSTSADSGKTAGVCKARRSKSDLTQGLANKTQQSLPGIDEYLGMSSSPESHDLTQRNESISSMRKYLHEKRRRKLDKIPEGSNSTAFEESGDDESRKTRRHKGKLPPPPTFEFPFEVNSRTNFEPGSATSSEIKTEVVSLRIALAARESLLNELQIRIKKANKILNHRFATLTAVPDLAISAAQFQDILTSHRKFVRWLNRYTIKGIEDIAKFEQLNIRGGMGGNSRVNYYVETRVPIRGKVMSGVFIPIPLNGGFPSEPEPQDKEVVSFLPLTHEVQIQENLPKEKIKIPRQAQALESKRNEMVKKEEVISPKTESASRTRKPKVEPISIVVRENSVPKIVKPVADENIQPQSHHFKKEEKVSTFQKLHTAMEDTLAKEKIQKLRDVSPDKTICTKPVPDEKKSNDSSPRTPDPEVTPRLSFKSCGAVFPSQSDPPTEGETTEVSDTEEIFRRPPRKSSYSSTVAIGSSCPPCPVEVSAKVSNLELAWTHLEKKTSSHSNRARMVATAEDISQRMHNFKNEIQQFKNAAFKSVEYASSEYTNENESGEDNQTDTFSSNWASGASSIETLVEFTGQKKNSFTSAQIQNREISESEEEEKSQIEDDQKSTPKNPFLPIYCPLPTKSSRLSQNRPSTSVLTAKVSQHVKETPSEPAQFKFRYKTQAKPSVPEFEDQALEKLSQATELNDIVASFGNFLTPFMDSVQAETLDVTADNLFKEEVEVLRKQLSETRIDSVGTDGSTMREPCRHDCPKSCNCPQRSKIPLPVSKISSPRKDQNKNSSQSEQKESLVSKMETKPEQVPIPSPRESLKKDEDGQKSPTTPAPRCRASFDTSNVPQGIPRLIVARPRVNPNPLNPNPELKGPYTTTYARAYNRFGWKPEKGKE